MLSHVYEVKAARKTADERQTLQDTALPPHSQQKGRAWMWRGEPENPKYGPRVCRRLEGTLASHLSGYLQATGMLAQAYAFPRMVSSAVTGSPDQIAQSCSAASLKSP